MIWLLIATKNDIDFENKVEKKAISTNIISNRKRVVVGLFIDFKLFDLMIGWVVIFDYYNHNIETIWKIIVLGVGCGYQLCNNLCHRPCYKGMHVLI